MSRDQQIFAVVPAAGHSRRMGQPKLLLPLGTTTVLGRLLRTLKTGAIADTVVVVRRDDERLRNEVAAAGARIVTPDSDPPDMRASVEYALQDIEATHHPGPDDGWLLVPGDHPLADAGVLDALLQRCLGSNASIVVPTYQGRRGHPTLFRWRLVEKLATLPRDRGINALLELDANDVCEVPVTNRFVLAYLDTPADYEALCRHVASETQTGEAAR